MENLGSNLTFWQVVLLGILGLVSWTIKRQIDELKAAEESLRQDRMLIYQQVLKPIIMLFTKTSNKNKDQITKKATEIMGSTEYREFAFNMVLIGSDEVVRSYNKMMKVSVKSTLDKSVTPIDLLNSLGEFLLAIRKSVGNKTTLIKPLEMISWMISDLDEFQKLYSEQSKDSS